MTPSINNDPDGLECYSDHAHDIRTVFECMFCGSTDVNVVGHILPDIQRLKGLDPVKASAIVLKTQSAKMFDGILLDYLSASTVQAVYTRLSTESARDKLRAMGLERAVITCFRVIQRAEEAKA